MELAGGCPELHGFGIDLTEAMETKKELRHGHKTEIGRVMCFGGDTQAIQKLRAFVIYS